MFFRVAIFIASCLKSKNAMNMENKNKIEAEKYLDEAYALADDGNVTTRRCFLRPAKDKCEIQIITDCRT